jgi:vacuolar protein sorting-associated protein 13A/C
VKFDAIEKLLHGKLPVHLKSAHLGHLLVRIPWANLTTEAVRILVEDVYVVATPKKLQAWDAKAEESYEESILTA